MAKIRHLSEIQQEIAFTEFDFYQRYAETFKTSELGRIKSLLPLREMAISFGLVEEKPKSLRVKRGRKSFFTPEGKVTLAFLKMYTGLSAPKLMEALNGNIHYQIFCGIRISPESQLTTIQADWQHPAWIVQEVEDPWATEVACGCLEAIHEEPWHSVHRCKLLWKSASFPDRCEVALGMCREGIQDDVQYQFSARRA